MYTGSPSPHGGQLTERLVSSNVEEMLKRAESLPGLTMNRRTTADLELLAVGGYSPLKGFMGSQDYHAVIEKCRLSNGIVWSIPVVLGVSKDRAAGFKEGQPIALKDEEWGIMAVLQLNEKFSADLPKESQGIYGTTERAHPGVEAIHQRGEVLLGGDVSVLQMPKHDAFHEYRLKPAETRKAFQERGWRTVVAFQTRNPIHRAHEYILKCGLEVCDGLLVHPLVGATKGDDIPADVRMRCYNILLDNYYPKSRVLLSVNPANMHYAGPREAIFHALIRKNYGCTHFIVGRDHAGVGKYYGTFDAQKIFLNFSYEALGIIPLFFDNSFWCKKCGGMASEKTCPHTPEDRVVLSGTKVREMLNAGQRPPAEFSRPEVADVLIEAMRT